MYVIFRTDGLTVCGRVKVRFEKIGPSVGVMCYVTWLPSILQGLDSKVRGCESNVGPFRASQQVRTNNKHPTLPVHSGEPLVVTCFFISLFNAQHISDVNTSILRGLRLICWVISWVVLLCVLVLRCGLAGVAWYPDAGWSTSAYLMLNMFRMLIHPSSGACDLFVELFHGLYCSGTMCVGVTLWFGWGGVVSGCR